MPDTLTRECAARWRVDYRRVHKLPRYAPDAPRYYRHRRQLEEFKKKLQELKRKRHESLMAGLTDAAERGDGRAFITTVRQVAWARNDAEDAARAIDLAFRIGAPTAAQYIYNESARRHADSPALQPFARLFSPESRVARRLPANETLKANREWLNVHRTAYRGQWVAVRNGELLATSTSLNELVRRVGDTTNVLLTEA